jgi:hypothetical protein
MLTALNWIIIIHRCWFTHSLCIVVLYELFSLTLLVDTQQAQTHAVLVFQADLAAVIHQSVWRVRKQAIDFKSPVALKRCPAEYVDLEIVIVVVAQLAARIGSIGMAL